MPAGQIGKSTSIPPRPGYFSVGVETGVILQDICSLPHSNVTTEQRLHEPCRWKTAVYLVISALYSEIQFWLHEAASLVSALVAERLNRCQMVKVTSWGSYGEEEFKRFMAVVRREGSEPGRWLLCLEFTLWCPCNFEDIQVPGFKPCICLCWRPDAVMEATPWYPVFKGAGILAVTVTCGALGLLHRGKDRQFYLVNLFNCEVL